jgi:outer membrane protein insertion porin family
LYQQIDSVDASCNVTATSNVTNATNANQASAVATCLGTAANTALGQSVPAFQEFFVGDTWKPRLAIGIGVNWNSPFGPFRINFSKVLVKKEGDDTKPFNFNVGTQF